MVKVPFFSGRMVNESAGSLLAIARRPGSVSTKTVYAPTQAAVLKKLDLLRQQKNRSDQTLLVKDTLGAFLLRWLEEDVKVNLAGKTYQEYELACRLYVIPFIGTEKLSKVNGQMLSSWQAKLAKKEFSDNTRLRSIRVLRNALNRAVKLHLIPFNPCAAVYKPKVDRKKVVPLEPEQCATLFKLCKAHRLGDMMILAATTGLRKGELLALEWSAVNLREGVLMVRGTLEEVKGQFRIKRPKSDHGRRTVVLGNIALDALKRRLEKAKEEGFDPSVVSLVFPNTLGRFERSSNFDRRTWHPIRKAAGIPDSIRFHDLRHTAASLMLAAGVSMKVVQEKLGHSDYLLTANTYSHLLQGAQAEAAAKVDDLLSSKIDE
ncbi:MAG: tyrosine-type recombinase/integrase [Planctomycetaceae bacterium]